MDNNEQILKIISNEVKDSINLMRVVTPSVYTSIFSQYATKHGVDIDDDTLVAKNIIQNECNKLTEMQEETSRNTQRLSYNTTKAIDAIKTKDESLLNEVLKETQALKHEIEKLRESLHKDELTHAYNRKWFHEMYTNQVESTFNKDGVLAMIDLNYFKEINDTHGHTIGDKVLIFIVNELKKINPKVVRYGGDEFLLIFEQKTSGTKAQEIITKEREYIIAKKLKAHDATFRVSFSFGVAEFKNGDNISLVLELADKNMYEDKQQIKKEITSI
ncbi:GGDEF domain-containing protein [Sulfurimonas sp.]